MADFDFMHVENNMIGSVLPQWLRTIGRNAAGLVFLPLAIQGNETAAALCALHDGAEIVKYKGHIYVESEWLCDQSPYLCSLAEIAKTRLDEYFGAQT